jgi:hypothetical protein
MLCFVDETLDWGCVGNYLSKEFQRCRESSIHKPLGAVGQDELAPLRHEDHGQFGLLIVQPFIDDEEWLPRQSLKMRNGSQDSH